MKLNSKLFAVILCSTLFLTLAGCSSLLVEPDPKGNAEKNFEIFWSDIYNTYPYFEKDQVDWLAVYKTYRPKVSTGTSDLQLYYILSNMLSLLSDRHKSLVYGEMVYASAHSTYYSNYDSSNVQSTYLQNKQLLAFGSDESKPGQKRVVSDYGITEDSILYYHVRTYFTTFSFENNFDIFSKQHPGAKGLILDVRNNGGGNVSTFLNFMGIFFDKPTDYLVIKEKTGPLPQDFAAPENYTIKPNSILQQFKKPVIVLASRSTASAAEHTVMAMKLRSNTTIVGDTTYGAFSFVLQRKLPNGMYFECVSTQATDVNGNNYEGIGLAPDERVILSSIRFQHRDDLMEKAIQLLNK